MNIVHVIGNGFDINQGIPTSYSHFYEYYLQLTGYANEPQAVKDFRSRLYDGLLKKRTDLWSDMERALGRDTKNISNVEDFITVYMNVYTHLMEYIDSAYNNSSVSKFEQMDKTIYKDLIAPWEHLVPRDRTIIHKAVPKNGDYNITVLSFNYTDTLNSIADLGNKRNTVIGTYEAARCHYNGCLHIHHEIKGRDIILGVDNEDQILNPEFKTIERVRNRLIKPQTNLGLGTMIDDECRDVIRLGNIFCLYGASLGETDNSWWKEIGKRMKKDLDVRILFFPYLKNIDQVQEIEKIDLRDEKKKELKEALGLEQKMYDDRIFVNFSNNPGGRNIFTNPKRADLKENYENVMAKFQKQGKIIKPENKKGSFDLEIMPPVAKNPFLEPKIYHERSILYDTNQKKKTLGKI